MREWQLLCSSAVSDKCLLLRESDAVSVVILRTTDIFYTLVLSSMQSWQAVGSFKAVYY